MCPFCGAICNNCFPEHPGNCETVFHTRNFRFVDNDPCKTFDHNTCYKFIAEGKKFIVKGEAYAYADHGKASKPYCDWDIEKDSKK